MTTQTVPLEDTPAAMQQPPWQLVRAIRYLRQAFQRGWQRQPNAWRPWLVTLVLGWPLTATLMIALSGLIQRLDGGPLLAWEAPTMAWLLQHSPLSIIGALWLEVPCHTVSVLFVVALAVVIALYFEEPYAAMTISFGVGLMVCIVIIGWQIAQRPRPDLVLNGALAPGFHSFPSGHIAHGTVLYGLLAYYWIRATQRWGERLLTSGLTALLLGAVGIGRLLVGAHWPTDVLGAFLIGGAWLGVLILAEERRWRKRPKLPVGQ